MVVLWKIVYVVAPRTRDVLGSEPLFKYTMQLPIPIVKTTLPWMFAQGVRQQRVHDDERDDLV